MPGNINIVQCTEGGYFRFIIEKCLEQKLFNLFSSECGFIRRLQQLKIKSFSW